MDYPTSQPTAEQIKAFEMAPQEPKHPYFMAMKMVTMLNNMVIAGLLPDPNGGIVSVPLASKGA